MCFIQAPADKNLAWYLAMEEYVGQHITDYERGVFFTWIVEPTVIFGRHQEMSAEVNLDYCRAHNIQVVQRKSGGGCVYADKGNLMLSYITPSTHAEKVFRQYLDTVANLLIRLGVNAVKTEHNDILVDGRKVSGNACYALKTGTIVHGTLLYDVDFRVLQQAITPPQHKLLKHGVQSVRQRVTNLKPILHDFSDIYQLSDYICNNICTETHQLTDVDIAAINLIEKTYQN